MKPTIRNYFSAAVLLLWGAAMLAGCSQADDTLSSGAAVARGGEPLNIRIAPKPGYKEADAADTRATVNDDTGAFAWEAGDLIRVRLKFDDAAATEMLLEWKYQPGNTAGLINDWSTVIDYGYDRDSQPVWPLGAGSVAVTAAYCDMRPVMDADYSFAWNYDKGTGDYMLFSKTFYLGEDLTVDFAHGTTRLVFTGLTPGTAYTLKAAGAEVKFPSHIKRELNSFQATEVKSFTSDASGNLTVCADLDDKISADGKLKLELVTGGATAYATTLTAQGTAGAYKMGGYIYKINVGEAGGVVNPDRYPNLLFPAPITPGFDAVEINGYWITLPFGGAIRWATDPSATVMDNDPCAGHGDWRLPTMEDFEKMAGWTETWPWSETVGSDQKEVLNGGAWDQAYSFGSGGGSYWSSVVSSTDPTKVWIVTYPGSGSAYYELKDKTSSASVRCVQPK